MTQKEMISHLNGGPTVDGTLMVGNDIDNISWDGYLSRGVHQIELRITDNRMEHGGTNVCVFRIDYNRQFCS
jgi:hypothetical protein